MNDRATLTLVLVALALACGTIFFERDVSTVNPPSEDQYDVFRGLKTENVERIVLVTGDRSVILRRGDTRWMFQRPLTDDYEIQWEANPDTVNRLVDALVALEQADRAIEGGDAIDWRDYGLQKSTDRIEVIYGSERGTVTAKLHVGKSAGPDAAGRVFVRLNDEDRVQIVEDTLGQFLALVRDGGIEFRSKNVFPRSDLDRSEGIVLVRPTFTARVGRASETDGLWQATWEAKEGDERKYARAQADFVGKLAGRMQGLRVESFVADTADQEDLRRYGLLDPQAHVILQLPQATGGILAMFSGPPSADIRIGKAVEDDETLVYAVAQRIPAIFTMKRAFLDSLPKDPLEALPSKKLAEIRSNDVTKIKLTHQGQTLRASLVDFNWKVDAPIEIDGDGPTFNALLTAATTAPYESIEWHANPAPKELGLRTPQTVLTLYTKREGRETLASQRIEFGKTFEREVPAAKEGDAPEKKTFIYARRAGDVAVRVYPLEKFESAVAGPMTFYKRRISHLNSFDATHLEITRPDGTYAFERRENEWHATSPFSLKADEGNVGGIVGEMSWLAGEKVVAAGPEALPTFGLDKPDYRIQVTVKAQEPSTATVDGVKPKPADDQEPPKPTTHVLLVSKKRDGDAVTWYGHAPDSPLIVTLAPGFAEKLDGEFATTVIFPAAFQAREAVLERGETITRLTRDADGAKYEVAATRDGPLSAADADAARAVFDALAALRVDGRYVAHDAKDMAPFGFAEPWGRATVSDRDQRTTTLEVGGVADEAAHGKGRRYARIAGTTGVFVVADESLAKAFPDAASLAPKADDAAPAKDPDEAK